MEAMLPYTALVQEAQDASALNHPNIITVYDIGENEQPITGVESSTFRLWRWKQTR